MSSAPDLHAELGRTPTPQVIQGAANLPAGKWSRLSDNPYENPKWFRFNETCFPRMQFLYFCIFDEAGLQAVLPAYDSHSPLYCDSTQVLPRAAAGLLKGMRFLIAGSPTSFRSEVIGPRRYADALIRFAWSYAAKNKFDLLSFPFLRSRLKHRLACSRRSMVDYNLAVPCGSFDEYLRSLGKKKRGTVRRELRHATPITHLPLAGHEEVMHRLYRLTADKHDAKGAVAVGFYRKLAAAFGGQAQLALAGDPADPKGALVYLLSGEGLWLFHCGVASRDLTYFQLVFYEMIRLAAERGLKVINYRPASDEAKVLRGCRPEQLYFSCLPATTRGRLCLQQVRELVADQKRTRLHKGGGVTSAHARPAGTPDPNRDLSFSAKVRRRMLVDRNPVLAEVQNKFTVREYARLRGVRTAPLHSVIRNASELSIVAMPENCFVQASHGSKWNVMRRLGKWYLFADGATLDSRRHLQQLSDGECLALLGNWLDSTYKPREWAYSVMEKHVLVGEILAPRHGPELLDYRFYTFDGQVKAINVGCPSYRLRNQNAFFDGDWRLIPLSFYRESLPDPLPDRPDTFAEMLDIAARLGTGLDFVRVDLFDTVNGVVLGEMTVYPEGGRIDSPTACPIFNQRLGRQWRLAASSGRENPD
jgi:hypothetical protein